MWNCQATFLFPFWILLSMAHCAHVFNRTIRQVKTSVHQLSHICVVYDETPANQILTDRNSGGMCQLLSDNQFVASLNEQSIHTKLITTANPLASYFTIQPRNHTLLTTRPFDREKLCSDVLSDQAELLSNSIQRCCSTGERDCDMTLTILVQIRRTFRFSNRNSNNSRTETLQSEVDTESHFLRLNLHSVDINDNAPRFHTNVFQISVSEGIKVGTRLQLPLAQDADSYDYGIVRYYLKSQNEDTFELDQQSLSKFPELSSTGGGYPLQSVGLDNSPYPIITDTYLSGKNYMGRAPNQLYLRLVRPLDWEVKKFYKFILVAEDNGSPALTGQLEIQITVTDENDNHPIFQNKSFTIFVAESTPNGKHLIQLIATDPDQGPSGQIVYSLVQSFENSYQPAPSSLKTHSSMYKSHAGSQSRNLSYSVFRIDAKTGWLILNSELDFEKTKHYLIRVTAKDQGGHPGFDEAVVNVMVTDVNDVPPIISVEAMLEGQKGKSSRETDKTSNSLDLYITEQERSDPSFSTNSFYGSSASTQHGLSLAFIVVGDPDTGQGGQFQCGLRNLSQLTNRLENMNNFHSQTSTFHNAVQLKTVQTLMELNLGNFRLNPISSTQFELMVVSGFDHEIDPLEQLVIICSDKGEPSLTSTFTINIHVEDMNDNAPEFTQSTFQFSLEENMGKDVKIGKLTASDKDSGENGKIKYTLDSSGSQWFAVNSKDGTLYSRVGFDREYQEHYRFSAFASDHGIPKLLTGTAVVEVTVLDVNDNAPDFVGLSHENCYKFRVAENEPINTHVGILMGMDADVHENSELNFRLVTSTTSFKLDRNTGEITTTQVLDREKQAEYELLAVLIDKGRQPLSSTTKISIIVTDVNDNDPIVVFPANGSGNVTVSFREPPGEVVARIEARDPDEDSNALLHYSLLTGNRNSIFRLESTSADLIIDRELGEVDVGVYPLEILIQDSGLPPRSAHVKLSIKVADTPARMYPHIYSPSKPKFLDSPGTGNESPQNDLGGTTQLNIHRTNGFVSAGAILVAIVALSCAIILVLLGITVYLCGRRGIGFYRQNNHGSHGIGGDEMIHTSTIDALKSRGYSPKTMETEVNNASHFAEPMFIDENRTMMRYPFASLPPKTATIAVRKPTDYAQKPLATPNDLFDYADYTTCRTLEDRFTANCDYETCIPRCSAIPFIAATSGSRIGCLMNPTVSKSAHNPRTSPLNKQFEVPNRLNKCKGSSPTPRTNSITPGEGKQGKKLGYNLRMAYSWESLLTPELNKCQANKRLPQSRCKVDNSKLRDVKELGGNTARIPNQVQGCMDPSTSSALSSFLHTPVQPHSQYMHMSVLSSNPKYHKTGESQTYSRQLLNQQQQEDNENSRSLSPDAICVDPACPWSVNRCDHQWDDKAFDFELKPPNLIDLLDTSPTSSNSNSSHKCDCAKTSQPAVYFIQSNSTNRKPLSYGGSSDFV